MLYFDSTNHNRKTVAGFNTGHNGGCCIIHEGKIVSVSEERLNRKKNSDGYINSFLYCLKALGIKASDVDLFVSSSYHKRLPGNFMGNFEALGISPEKFITVDHHLSHAYSAYVTSPFDSAIVLAIDGLGNEADTESYYIGEGATLKKIGGNDPKRSIYKGIGRAYESFTNFIGWSAQEAGKTMGLAAYGEETNPELDLYSISQDERIESALEGKYYHGALNFVQEHQLDFGKSFSGFENKNAAFFVQDRTEKIILELVRRLYEKHKMENICLSGGVFLNSIINKKILDETPIKNVFVPPCCDDTGQPFGNALYGYVAHFKNPFKINMSHGYLGREYGDDEILDVLEKRQEKYTLPYETKSCDFEFKKCDDVAEEGARCLSEGKLVGWFQGSSEIGPRALGHRSILTAPFPEDMKETLNVRIKHRENFRPFAPAILEERVSEFFMLDRPSPFMLLIAKGVEDKRGAIPAVLHVDGTARLQTVNKEEEKFYKLISSFEQMTGVPIVLNTSFNDNGEPIVETPRDALNMFCKSELDYLFLGDYMVWKK